MMIGFKSLVIFSLSFCFLGFSLGRPPSKIKHENGPPPPSVNGNGSDWDLGVEYNRYLQEIVQVLESDPDFRKKLENADVEKIRDGSIAHELEFVNHHVRSQLDDIKRRELERLRHAAMREYELNQGIDRKHIVNPDPQHIQLSNARFEIDDLKKLIKKTTADLEEADNKRRDDFKKYEMEKKFEEEERLKHIENEGEREKEKIKLEESHKRHKDHEKLNHPMTKDQLEEVWEKQDHMEAQDWDPKTFFAMHDLNGDGHWDENELKTLFQKELDKAYDPNNKDDDMKEREEEMERMREHVYKESDKNKDRLISWEEFLDETKRDEFKNDPGWDTVEEDNEIYSDEEFKAFEIQRQREIQEMLNRGIVPPGYPYYGEIPEGALPYHPNGVPIHPGSIPGQPAYHPPSGQPIQYQQPVGQPQYHQPGAQQFQGQHQQPMQPLQHQPIQHQQPVQPVQHQPIQHQQPVQPVQHQPIQHQQPVQPVQHQPIQHQQPVQPVQHQPIQHQQPVQPVQHQPIQHQQQQAPLQHQQPIQHQQQQAPVQHQQPIQHQQQQAPVQHQQPLQQQPQAPVQHHQPPVQNQPESHQQPPQPRGQPAIRSQGPTGSRNFGSHEQQQQQPPHGVKP